MPYVKVWVDTDEAIEDISTADLAAELARRAKDGDKDAREPDWRDWDRLADFIAEGRTADALDLLAYLSPAQHVPATTLYFAQARARR